MPAQPTASAIEALLAAAERHDGYPPLSEHKLVRLSSGTDRVLASRSHRGDLTALVVGARHSHADGSEHWAVEVVLGPSYRDPMTERDVMASVAELVPAGSTHTVWAWREGQIAALRRLDYRPIRRILRLERSLPIAHPVASNPGVEIASFVAGVDEPSVVAVANRALAGHPEDGNLTAAGLAERMRRPWFDAAGLLLARTGPDVVGFCWTKFHGEHLGEVYLIAVDAPIRERGIGRTLLTAGLDDLHRRCRAGRAMLWVGSDNAAARRLYDRMGFQAVLVNTEFARSSAQPKR